jgi:hypothetical protein
MIQIHPAAGRQGGRLGDGMESDLATLTSAAAVTLVRLMATDGWDRVKSAVVSLWRRVHPEGAAAVDAELSAACHEVLAARRAQDEQAELDLVGEWRSRLRQLVASDPQLQEDLHRLIEEFRPAVAEVEAARIGSVTMQAKATGHGQVYQAARDQKIVKP